MIRIIREEEPTKPSTRLSTDDSLPSLAALRQTEPRKLMALLRGELDWVVMKCLEKHRDRRYDTANGLARDIQRYLADEPVEARPPSASYRLAKLARRHKVALITTGIVAAALVLGAALSLWQAVRASRAESSAVHAERVAVVERDEATRRRNEAESARENLRRTLYAADMGLAQAAWEGGRVGEVLKLLDQEKAGNPDLCGFEWNYWMRQCHQDVRTLHIPGLEARGSFSTDGTRIVSRTGAAPLGEINGFRETEWTVWDTTSGKQISSFAYPEGDGNLPSLSSDGSLMAIGLTSLQTLHDESSPAHEHTLAVIDANTGRRLVTRRLENSPRGLLFSSDGRKLAGIVTPHGARGKPVPGAAVHVWDSRTGNEVRVLTGIVGGYQTPAISPDGTWIAAATLLEGNPSLSEIRVWELGSGRVVASLPTTITAGESGIHLNFSPDGQALGSVAESPGRSELQVWDMKTRRSRFAIHGPLRTYWPQVAFSPDSRFVAWGVGDLRVGVWDSASGQELRQYLGHQGGIFAIAFSRDGRILQSADASGRVKAWEGPATAKGLILNPEEPAPDWAISPDARRIATVTSKGASSTVKLWDSTGRLLCSQKTTTPRNEQVNRSLQWSARGHRLACATYSRVSNVFCGNLAVLDQDGKELFHVEEEGTGFFRIALSPDGKRVAASLVLGSRETYRVEARVWDVATGRPLCTIPARLTFLAFDPDGKSLAGFAVPRGGPNRLLVWDAVTGAELANLEAPTGWFSSIAFSPDGKRIAATTDSAMQHELVVWELGSGKFVKLGQASTGVTFSPDGARIAAYVGSETKAEIGLWDAVTGRQLLVLKGHCRQCALPGDRVLPGGRPDRLARSAISFYMATGGQDLGRDSLVRTRESLTDRSRPLSEAD